MSAGNDSALTKRCTKCGNEFPATREYFTPNKGGKYGLRPDCNKCRSLLLVPRHARKYKRKPNSHVRTETELFRTGPCVYVVYYSEVPNLYKIGSALEFDHRVKELEAGTPFYLKVEHIIKCSSHATAKLLEQAIHRNLKPFRFSKREWFTLSSDHLARIKNITICETLNEILISEVLAGGQYAE